MINIVVNKARNPYSLKPTYRLKLDYEMPPRATLTGQYHGRAHTGWFFVEFEDMWWNTRAIEKEIDAWIADNIQGPHGPDAAGRIRRYFRDETDAMLCFMAFR